MKKISVFFCGFFGIMLLVFMLFILIVNFCGRGVCDQPWIRELYPLKKHMVKQQQNPKIIIIGGSSSLFGISGEKLREYTGMDNINFSMSIMIPMRFYLVELEKYVKEGDIVVLPLELTHHYQETEEKNFSNLGISLLFGCLPETQKTLTVPELCSLYFQYGFSWINTSLFHQDGPLRRIFHGGRSRQNIFDGVYKESYVVSRREQAQGKKGQLGWFSDLSIHGDWLIDQKAAACNASSFPLSTAVTEEFVYSFRQIQKLVKTRGATLLLVWPNNYFYPEQSGFTEFRDLLAKHGITIYGHPEATAFPRGYYHDPPHHMNRHGAELWTWELAKTISQATGRPLKKHNQAWPYIVFADNPAGFFPGAKTNLYDTGVRIGQKEFSMALAIPETLRGKELELELIANPEQKRTPVFSTVTVSGTPCKMKEKLYQERAETVISLPSACTNQEKVTLSCSIIGNSIGMERLFIRERPPAGTPVLKTGFAAPEDWGRWTDGKRAEMAFSVPDEYRGKDLVLKFDVYTFVCEKRPVCKFRILTNGKILKEMVSDKFDNSFTMNIPADLLRTGELPLTIEIENPCSPKELGVSEDTRKLGLGIKSIVIVD